MKICVGCIMRRNSDGAHAEVLREPDERGVMTVRYGIAGSRNCAPGVRLIQSALASEFTVTRACCVRDHDEDGNCDRHPRRTA